MYNFAFYFCSDCSKAPVKVITYYKWVSCLLIIYFKTVCVLFLLFVYVYNRLDYVPSFKYILFVFMKIFQIMISFANFIEFVYNILAYFILIVYGCFCFITSSSDEFSIEDILFLTDVIIPFVNHGFSINFCFFLDSFSIGAYVSRSVSIIWKNRSNELSTFSSSSLSAVCQLMFWRSRRNTLGSNRLKLRQ